MTLAPHYGPAASPLLIDALRETHDYDAAWNEVKRCREATIELDAHLIEKLRIASGRLE